ncbi:MAG TPA: Crp/Fnr family transcriptional regulator [Myxococcales bacterium]
MLISMSDMLAAGSLDHLVRRHPAGTMLFREGDKGEKMYVIRSGKVNIWKQISDSEITLAVLGSGEFFGEMALLEGLPRSAGATVVEEALLIEVEQAAFETLVRKNGEIAVRLMRRLSSRLREADRQIQSLMSRSGAARALSLVRKVAEPPDKKGRRRLPADLTPDMITARVGLSRNEARRVQRSFERSGLLIPAEGGRWALGPDQLISDFLLYVELQEQYDPLNVHELAELAGLNDEDAEAIARRVLQARLADARKGSQQLVDTYSTYLALKQRFEYSE